MNGVPTNRGVFSPESLLGELLYINYEHNRRASPATTVESWRKVYGDEVYELEARYQADRAIAKAAA